MGGWVRGWGEQEGEEGGSGDSGQKGRKKCAHPFYFIFYFGFI